jgi:stage III sporulation protein AD
MIDGFGSVLAAALLVCIISLLLKNFGFKGVPVFVCIGILCIISYLSESIFTIVPMIGSFGEDYCDDIYVKSVIKIIGIGYASGICKDICEELGEGAVAKCITLAGRLEIMAICTPFIGEMIELAVSVT